MESLSAAPDFGSGSSDLLEVFLIAMQRSLRLGADCWGHRHLVKEGRSWAVRRSVVVERHAGNDAEECYLLTNDSSVLKPATTCLRGVVVKVVVIEGSVEEETGRSSEGKERAEKRVFASCTRPRVKWKARSIN